MIVDWSCAEPVEWPDDEFGSAFGFIPIEGDVAEYMMRNWWTANPPHYRRVETAEGVHWAIERTKEYMRRPSTYNTSLKGNPTMLLGEVLQAQHKRLKAYDKMRKG